MNDESMIMINRDDITTNDAIEAAVNQRLRVKTEMQGEKGSNNKLSTKILRKSSKKHLGRAVSFISDDEFVGIAEVQKPRIEIYERR